LRQTGNGSRQINSKIFVGASVTSEVGNLALIPFNVVMTFAGSSKTLSANYLEEPCGECANGPQCAYPAVKKPKRVLDGLLYIV